MKLKALKTWTSLAFGEDVKRGDTFDADASRARQLVKDGRAEKARAPRKAKKTNDA